MLLPTQRRENRDEDEYPCSLSGKAAPISSRIRWLDETRFGSRPPRKPGGDGKPYRVDDRACRLRRQFAELHEHSVIQKEFMPRRNVLQVARDRKRQRLILMPRRLNAIREEIPVRGRSLIHRRRFAVVANRLVPIQEHRGRKIESDENHWHRRRRLPSPLPNQERP